MKPLNTEERKKSFTTFLLFFIITIALIVGAVYFGIQIPFAQNARLKEQVARFQKENAAAESFAQKLAATKGLLDTVNKNGVQATVIDGQILDNIKALNSMVGSDSSANKQLYQTMVQCLDNQQIALKQLRDASGKDANLANTAQELAQTKMDLATCKSQNLQLQQMQMMRNNAQPQQAQQPH